MHLPTRLVSSEKALTSKDDVKLWKIQRKFRILDLILFKHLSRRPHSLDSQFDTEPNKSVIILVVIISWRGNIS